MKKIVLVIILIVVVILGAKYIYTNNKDQLAQVSGTQSVRGTVTEADIPAVKEVALKLADKDILKNKEELKKILSKKTIELMDSIGWDTTGALSETLLYVDAMPQGRFMIVNMKDSQGKVMPMPFLKEDGVWKFAPIEAIEMEAEGFEKAQAAEVANTSNKKADLIITKIETSKSPNVLDPKTEIKVTAKNNGKFTVSPAQVDIDIYNAKNDRKGISTLSPILKPGESAVVNFKPFADIRGQLAPEGPTILPAGSRKIIAKVNAFKRVPESNYANNSLTKNVVFTRKAVPGSTPAPAKVTQTSNTQGSAYRPYIDKTIITEQDIQSYRTQIYSWGAISSREDCINAAHIFRTGISKDEKTATAHINTCLYILQNK